MNKSRLMGALCACVFTFVTTTSHAALVSVLSGQAAYDDVLGITWLTDADLSGSGGSTWPSQLAWVSGLNTANHLGFNDWRLASMSVAAGLPTGTTTSVVDCSSATELACRDNELGYMFYQNLGGSLSDDLTGNKTVGDVTLTDIQASYWSGTEFDISEAWGFRFVDGIQGESVKGNGSFGWAVRSGNASAVPVPAAVWLFGSGLIGLMGIAKKRKAT